MRRSGNSQGYSKTAADTLGIQKNRRLTIPAAHHMQNYPVHSNFSDHAKKELSPKFQNVGICGTDPTLQARTAPAKRIGAAPPQEWDGSAIHPYLSFSIGAAAPITRSATPSFQMVGSARRSGPKLQAQMRRLQG